MKVQTIIFVLILLSFNVFSQLKVKIVDSKNKAAIAFVNIKFDDSQRGVFSDIDGYFELKNNCCKRIKLSYIGYHDAIIEVSTLNSENNIIELKKKLYQLKAVEILPEENPAFTILRKVLKNKKINNPEELNSFSYRAYHKFIITADAEELESYIKKNNQADSVLIKAEEFFSSQHLLISESISKRNYKFPNKNKEEVIATRFSGLQHPKFAILGSELQSFSFYNPSIDVLEKHYINPINKQSLKKYFYLLEDSIYTDIDTTYIISFRPYKGTNFDGLKGQVHISSKGWAIKNVRAKPAEDNPEFGAVFQQKYELIDGKYWFPTQINTDIIFYNLIISNTQAKGAARTYISNIEINKVPKKRIRFNNEVLIISNKALEPKSEEYWDSYRTQELDSLEVKTYHVIDSIGKATNLDEKLWAIMALSSGKIPWGPIDLLMDKFLGYNVFEGFRFGLGVETNDRVSNFFSIGGYGAWATEDFKWKYGGNIKLNLWPNQSMTLKLAHSFDIEESAMQYSFNESSSFSYGDLRYFIIDEMYYAKTNYAALEFRALPHSSWLIDAKYSSIISPNNYQYNLNSETNKGNYIISEFGIAWRFAFKEKLYRTGNTSISMGTKYPIFNIKYTKAISGIQGSELDYEKLDLQIDFSYPINFFGKQSWRITAGKAIGETPWYKLYNGKASFLQWYTEAPNTFGTMRFNEFLSDEYIAVYFRHDFKNLLFGDKAFVPQPIFITSAIFGNLQNAYNHQNIDFNTLEKGYYESGILLNSILRSGITNIGIGVFYRWGPYTFDNVSDNFAYKITVGYSL